MFVKTQSNTLINLDRATCLDLLKYLNRDCATIKVKIDGCDFDIYTGTTEEAENAFHTLEEALIHGASFVDYSK